MNERSKTRTYRVPISMAAHKRKHYGSGMATAVAKTVPTQRLISRAEGGLDLIVYRRFFAGRKTGTCIEVGAARPDYLSVGALFREAGWDVLSIEPNPHFAAMHRALGHSVIECACAAEDADAQPFTVVDSGNAAYSGDAVTFESFSALAVKPDYAALARRLNTRQVSVDVRRLDTLLADYRSRWNGIDLIVVDVEGWELEVLSGLDFGRHRPRVLIVENHFCRADYRRFMRERGYFLWRCAFPNEVWAVAVMIGRIERLRCRSNTAIATVLRKLRLALGRVKRAALRREGARLIVARLHRSQQVESENRRSMNPWGRSQARSRSRLN